MWLDTGKCPTLQRRESQQKKQRKEKENWSSLTHSPIPPYRWIDADEKQGFIGNFANKSWFGVRHTFIFVLKVSHLTEVQAAISAIFTSKLMAKYFWRIFQRWIARENFLGEGTTLKFMIIFNRKAQDCVVKSLGKNVLNILSLLPTEEKQCAANEFQRQIGSYY